MHMYACTCTYARSVKTVCSVRAPYGMLVVVQVLLLLYSVHAVHAYQAKFHAAGREDVDVRMLGEGRCGLVMTYS